MKFISNNLFHFLAITTISIGINEAWQLRWLCDDAFISFTYARNLSEGIGLVFQSGEYVEGYSNFLWTIILAFFTYIKLSPLIVSQVIGIFFYGLLLVYFYRKERKERPFVILPIFIVHLAVFFHGWIFATSGLETMMFTVFLTLGLLEWHKKSGKENFFLLLSAITRPEGMLFFILNLFTKRREIARIRTYIPILLILFLLLLRFFYYGDLLPNTFYAKANRPAYFSQGIFYLLYWFRVYPLYFPIFAFALFILIRNLFQKENSLLSTSLIIYIIYVLYVGGDFMAMRFWLPIIPYFSWIVYESIGETADKLQIDSNLNSTWSRLIQKNINLIYLFFTLSLAIYLNPFIGENKEQTFWHNVGEERRFYENSLSLGTGYDALAFKDIRVAFFGAQAHFIYFMRPAYAWEAESGLTDSKLAKQKKGGPRGRVGHERMATPDGLLERDVEFLLANRFPELDLPYIQFLFRGFDWHIFVLKFHSNQMKQLCSREGWDCSRLYKELKRRKLDTEKDHVLWHD